MSKLSENELRFDLKSLIINKVDKVDGKGLSTNDYTTTERNKLTSISLNANNYIHPSTHPANIIVQDANHRFVTDIEKQLYNNKQDLLTYTPLNKAGDTMTGRLTMITQSPISLLGDTYSYMSWRYVND